MEMSALRGPSAEDHHHVSPEGTTNIPAAEDLTATRKCCTLCNLSVSSEVFSLKLIE
jgi:hypothetical protein